MTVRLERDGACVMAATVIRRDAAVRRAVEFFEAATSADKTAAWEAERLPIARGEVVLPALGAPPVVVALTRWRIVISAAAQMEG